MPATALSLAGTRLAAPGAMPAPRAFLMLALALPAACAGPARVHPRAAEEVARGYGYLRSDDLERAGIAFEHALELARELPEALNGAAVVARRRGDLAAARRLYDRALAVNPELAEALVNLGELEAAEGRGHAAEEAFRRALAIDPDLAPARLDLARTLLHRGRADAAARPEAWARARREYLHLLEARPELAEAHHDLAYMDLESGELERAAREYARAAELSPGYAEALHGLCVARARQGLPGDGACIQK